MADSVRRYLFEYRHQGAEWALELVARDMDDALARLDTLPTATFMGELADTLPIPTGLSSPVGDSNPARPRLRLICDNADSSV